MSASVVVGLALALACLAYVLYPIVAGGLRGDASPPLARPPGADAPASQDVTDEEIEAAVKSYRAARATPGTCVVCGPRPEPDALYCSSCGRRLPAADAARQPS